MTIIVSLRKYSSRSARSNFTVEVLDIYATKPYSLIVLHVFYVRFTWLYLHSDTSPVNIHEEVTNL